MGVEYDYSQNTHTVDGPRTALPLILEEAKPRSLLDVGCGLGTWMKAALEFGVQDVFGVDGVGVEARKLLVAENLFHQCDLTKPWSLGRRFEAALCLEVAEHLEEAAATSLVDSLIAHSDVIYFSAACPGQPGQHHVNCQWPGYWQNIFNERGYVCSDAIRWKIWSNKSVECWYRQNLFTARKNAAQAGKEARIPAVLHPEVSEMIIRRAAVERIEDGRMSVGWYAGIPFLAMKNKLARRLS
ncbi:MAG TPA: class I SAM-dependent methyltransferase [Candidatus Cybelea sp.]|nr:class I SAM-dependent methyltransferase [Candidatus Cybelea sp.]